MPLPSVIQAHRRFGASWVNGMLLAERIRLISDHDRFVAHLFRVQVSEAAACELVAWARPQGIKVEFELRREDGVDVIYVLLKAR
jgi:hypothetical protein